MGKKEMSQNFLKVRARCTHNMADTDNRETAILKKISYYKTWSRDAA